MKRDNIYVAVVSALLPIIVFSENINSGTYITPDGKEVQEISTGIEKLENSQNDEDLIYLDKIIETEEEKKEESTTKLERAIKKIDQKVNPVRIFNINSSYGNWYLIKTTGIQESRYENIAYNFKQEQNGYRIEKNYYNSSNKEWITANERGWIEEKKGKVYLGTEKKWFMSYSNEILFFDKNYRYMIIKYESDGIIRVFSRKQEKVTLEGEEKDRFDKILNSYPGFENINFNPDIDNIREEKERKKAEIERQAKIMEEQIKKNPESVFEINEFKK